MKVWKRLPRVICICHIPRSTRWCEESGYKLTMPSTPRIGLRRRHSIAIINLVPDSGMRPPQTYLLAQEKAIGTISVFPIKNRSLRDIHTICYRSGNETHKRTEYPALRTIKLGFYATSNVFAAPQRLDSVCISDTVTHPVCRCKLVVPHAFVELLALRFS